ncbi:hypothetical protein [Alkalicoccus chagannorensis]|uniref:hypothetical protein n=1 Tax=Alkalicoccus chagannorensis TaxID=427072 RepID=UPI0004043218|nr:hypothetical protein [Alkalicoccus chagannorensis]
MLIKNKNTYISLIVLVCSTGLILLSLVQFLDLYPGVIQYEMDGEEAVVTYGLWNTEEHRAHQSNIDDQWTAAMQLAASAENDMKQAARSAVLLLVVAGGASLYAARMERTTTLRTAAVAGTFILSAMLIGFVLINYLNMMSFAENVMEYVREWT